jgi:O-acetyl-ADP-ribose deacetylase (regulator of RNase III)
MEEIKGDLFSCCNDYSLAHCVSEDLVMGKGIAVEFKKRFGHVPELKAQQAMVGSGCVLHHNERGYIYYLVTKKYYNGKPTMETLKASCEWMKQHALEHGVYKIAMPRIGCGLDKMQWSLVKEMLLEIFSGTDIKLIVYYL